MIRSEPLSALPSISDLPRWKISASFQLIPLSTITWSSALLVSATSTIDSTLDLPSSGLPWSNIRLQSLTRHPLMVFSGVQLELLHLK